MYGTAYLSLSLLPLQWTHLKIDWINTGHHKNLDTIGKQNHQEPGVEAIKQSWILPATAAAAAAAAAKFRLFHSIPKPRLISQSLP